MHDLANKGFRHASRLQGWIEGRRNGELGVNDVDVLAGPAARPEMAGSLPVGTSSILFAPEAEADAFREHTTAEVVSYIGEFSSTGAEIGIGDDLVVQIESYSTVEYLPIVCPTAISLVDDTDLALLSIDVNRARETGGFPSHLTHPLVTFVDLVPLLDERPEDSTAIPRLYLQDDDTVFSGPGMRRVHIQAELLNPSATTPLPAFLEAYLASEPNDARYLRRFIEATRALQLASQRIDGDLLVSGFGWSASGGTGDRLVEPAGSPFVLKAGEDFFVADIRRHRFGKVTAPVAEVVDSVSRGCRPSRSALSALGLLSSEPAHVEPVFRKLGLDFPTTPVPSNG